MTLAEVIALINSDIVPNGNNEITANVLRPILIEMLQQPNDLIGELDELNTVENDTLVKAINSINNALSDVDGLTILSGQGDPNGQSFPSLSIADLYSEIDGLGSPLALWIYDGTKFIRFSDKYLSYEIPQTLTPIEQLTARNNIGATDRRLEELASDLSESERNIIRQKISATSLEDLNGLLENPTYDSDTHIFTMDIVGGGTFSIDFPIEALITNVDLDDDNNLVITFEDGSEVLVPLNTLLVGVVKSVNGQTPNSMGALTVNIADIPNLTTQLSNKLESGDNVSELNNDAGYITSSSLPTNYITTNTNQTGLSGNKTTSGTWTFGQVRKAGQTDTQMLLAGGGHRPVSDFALAGSLSSYVPYTGATANVNLNGKNLTNSKIRSGVTPLTEIPESGLGGHHFEVGNSVSTGFGMLFGSLGNGQGYIQQGRTDGSTTNYQLNLNPNGGVVRIGGDLVSASNITANGQINTPTHGNSSEWKQAYDATQNLTTNYVTTNGVQNITATKTFTVAPIVPNGTLNGHTVNLGQLNDKLGEKADVDGSNTIGGTWNVDALANNDVGNYVSNRVFSNAMIGIPSTDALGSTTGVMLMGHGSPIAIAENENTDWDGYIYRAGTPLSGYPANQQNGNYLIESKHRFRLHTVTAPDSTSGNVGSLQINPFNGIEHNYFRVTISSVDSLDITIDEPYYDEITGFNIERNAIGQKCTVAVSGGLSLVKFNNVSGADFTSEWNKGVFEFYWTGDGWIFGGYSPIEP